MKILQVHNFYQTPGGEDGVVKLEKELLEANGHTVIHYYRHNNEIKNYGFFQKIKFFVETVYSRKTFKELNKVIDAKKPDVAHVHNVFPLISPSCYFCLKTRDIAVVQTIHNFRFLCPKGFFYIKGAVCEKCKNGNTLHCLFNRCYKDSFLLSGLYALTFWLHRKIKTFQKKIDIFITLSTFAKNKLVEGGFLKGKIEIEKHFLPQIKIRPDYRKEDYAIFIGRLSREKGLIMMLKALQKVNKIKFKVVGKGNLEQSLKGYVAKNNMPYVEFLGYITGAEKFKLLQKARFSVVSSEGYENLPISVLESFSIGTPVIASRIGGLPELVEDGKSGLLFEPGNPDDLAEKISYLYENPDKALEMGEYARKCVEEKYNEENHYNRLMEIYKRAIEQNKRKISEP